MKDILPAASLALAVLLTGCVTTGREPECYDYPKQDFKVCKADAAFVGKTCGGSSRGCADRAHHVVWVAWGSPEPETTLYAICGMLGNKPEDCEKIRGGNK